MSAAITTSLPLPWDSQNLVANVVGADTTATTYVLNCPSGTDSNDCGVYNASVTVGPWASQTLPSGAAETGNYDMSYSMDTFQFSLHCEMSKTVAQKCITINLGGNDDGHPTATFTASDDLDEYTLTYVPVTVTAGQDALSATHSATATESNTKATASSTKASASGSQASASSSGAEPKETGAATSRTAGVLAAISVAVLATTTLLM